MNTELLSMFVDVARQKSFAGVARASARDPSAVSRSIAQLEKELGTRLFERSTRSMSLTESGEHFLQRVEPLLEEMRRAVQEIAQTNAEPSGVLRIAAPVSFGHTRIMPLMRAFRAQYPKIALDCVFTDELLDMRAQRVDLAIRFTDEGNEQFESVKLVNTPHVVVASPGYLAQFPKLRAPTDLAAHECLLFPMQNYRSDWLFRDESGHVFPVQIKGDITLSTFQALMHGACSGLGPTLLPKWQVQEALDDGRLVSVFPDHEVTVTEFDSAVWALTPLREFVPAKVRVFTEFLREHLAQRPLQAAPAQAPASAQAQQQQPLEPQPALL